MNFIGRNLKYILTYLKHQTKSHKIFVDSSKNAIHVEYILRFQNAKNGNEQSVSRLKYICRTLPIFDHYCADALRPTLDVLSAYNLHDDSHKEMPRRNLVIMFHQDLTSLWNKTIMSNYEFDTVAEWLEYWFDVRKRICLLMDKYCSCIYKLLGGRALGSLAGEVDHFREELVKLIICANRYPKEERPFEKKATVPEGLGKIKQKYFGSIQNFINQFAGFIARDEKKQKLAMLNLIAAKSALGEMQDYFAKIAIDFGFQEKHLNLSTEEKQNIEQMIRCCRYYQKHLPNKYFDKYQINNWYENYCLDERRAAENGLAELKNKYSVHFPDCSYTVDMLRYYPIVIDNFDMTSEDGSTEWFEACIGFADAPFDYLVILSTNESKEINPFALQIPKQLFTDAKRVIEEENPSLAENLKPPYPVNVTVQMLDCFSEKYSLLGTDSKDIDTIPIDELAEELWIYSKSIELLTEPEDASYLALEIQSIRGNITGMLCSLKDKILPKDVDWITEICDSVFSGEKFDDFMFNNVINHFIQKSVKNKTFVF